MIHCRWRARICFGLLAWMCAPAFAADATSMVIHARLEPTAVAAGQSATLYIDVYTNLFFTSGIDLPALNVPGAIVRLSDERPPHISTQISGQSWSGIEHKYSITPIVASDLTIPEFGLSVHVGPQSKLVTMKTKPVTVHVSTPPGSEGAFVTLALHMTQKTDADLSALKVGDAFTRTVELKATGTPAMFIPDVAFTAIPGLKAYPQTPMASDSAPGTPLIGSRTFSVTYLAQRAGDYELPAIDIRWWNIGAKKLETASAAALSVHVAATAVHAPAFALPTEKPAAPPVHRVHWRAALIAAGRILGAALMLWWLTPRAVRFGKHQAEHYRKRRSRYRESERYAFRQLQRALRRPDVVKANGALYRWLDRMPASHASQAHTVQMSTDPGFLDDCQQLFDACYGIQPTDAGNAMRRLAHSARRARRLMLSKRDSSPGRSARLPALNPCP